MSAETRLAELLEVITVPSNRGRLTNSALGDITSPEVADTVYDLIKASTESYAIQFVVNGIDTTTAAWKARVDAIQVNDPGLAQIKPLIRDWESLTTTRWQSLGYESQPTLESVQSEIDAEVLSAFARSLIQRASAAINLAAAADGATEQSIRDAAIAEIGGQ